MKIKYFFIIFLCSCLISCNSFDFKKNQREVIINKIGEQKSLQIERASGAIHATETILNKSPNKDIYTEAAKKTNSLASNALPNTSLGEEKMWEEIAEGLIQGNDRKYNKIKNELIKSEEKEHKLEKKLADTTSELFFLHEEITEGHQKEIEELMRGQELKKKLMMYFAGAAALCAIGSAILGYFLGIRIAINGAIAAGFFGLAAYLVTQSFFAYIAAGMAVVMFAGTIYYVCGQLRPKRAIKKTAEVLEKMSNSEEGFKRNAAKLVKKEIQNSLVGKEAQKHKEYVRSIKKEF